MAEIKVKDGQAYCAKCGRNVAVRGQKPLVLVDDQGHVIAERYTSAGAWNHAA